MKNTKLAVLLMVVALFGFSACKSTEMAQDAAMPAPSPDEEMAGEAMTTIETTSAATTNAATNSAASIQSELATPAIKNAGVDIDGLIAKHIEARGGRDNIKAVQAIKMTGTIQMMGTEIGLTSYIKRPNKLRSIILIKSMNMEMNQGYDGEMGWMQQPGQTTAQPMPKAMARGIKDQANIDGSFMDYEERGYTIEHLGEAVVKDRPAHKLKLIRPDHPDTIVYLDKESYLEVKIDAEGVNPQSGLPIETETFITEYRLIEGIQMPSSVEVTMGGNVVQSMQFDTIEINPEIDEELFKMPMATPGMN